MTKEKFTIKINNKEYEAQAGQTVLQIARANNIEIPTLCYHPDLPAGTSCRLCVVEIKDQPGLHTACSTKVFPDMEVITESETISRTRKINYALLYAQFKDKPCKEYDLDSCKKMHDLAEQLGIDSEFKNRRDKYLTFRFGPSIEFDSSKCIECRNCIRACAKQVSYLELHDKGEFHEIGPSKDVCKDCIYCGQCIVACPVGALQPVKEIKQVEEALQDKSKTVVFQFAPSIRVSIGEEFGLPPGEVVTKKLAAGIKTLGADKVFDTSVGADFTTVEEARELIQRIRNNEVLPMMTSCCPAWVKYIEFYQPEFIPNLTTVRSPHIILGALIKKHWAQNANINSKDIVNVSIMPCTAKKFEIRRSQIKIKDEKPVDYVLTTRELAFLMKKNNINLATIEEQEVDNPLGFPSGAGVIYGASGGVMESALRTAYKEITGLELNKIEFEDVRGITGIKKASLKIKDQEYKIAVVNGIENAKVILEELKQDPTAYHYIEIMACPGGCISGGGQPMPTTNEIRQKRIEGLYSIDSHHKMRRAHDNPIVKEVYEKYLTNHEIIHEICHTSYKSKKRT